MSTLSFYISSRLSPIFITGTLKSINRTYKTTKTMVNWINNAIKLWHEAFSLVRKNPQKYKNLYGATKMSKQNTKQHYETKLMNSQEKVSFLGRWSKQLPVLKVH